MSAHSANQTVLPFQVLTTPLDPGVTLVEASAGTGKTFAITRLVLRLLLERKVDNLSRILVVTFTEKATQELVTRIRATLRTAERVWSDTPPSRDPSNEDLFQLKEVHGDAGRDIVSRALGSLDDLAVSTIHGFCQRILAESALESRIPFRTAFIEDETEPFQRAARDWARVRLLTGTDEAQSIVDDGSSVDSWVKSLVLPFRRQQDTRIELDASSNSQRLLADFITTVRWSSLFWRVFDWSLLMLVLFHGFMGGRTVLVDYTSGRRRRILVLGLYVIALILFVLGTTVVTTLPVVPKA